MGTRVVTLLLVAAMALAACGSDDETTAADGTGADGGDTTTETDGGDQPAALPAECEIEVPFTLQVEGGESLPGVEGGTFEAQSLVASQQPIVPDPDQEMSTEEIREAAATTPIVAYTVYLADYELTTDDLGLLGPSEPESGTLFFISVVPPTEAGLSTGDVVDEGVPEFDSVTTFGSLGVGYQTSLSEDAPNLALGGDGDGTAEILYLDDQQICMAVQVGGTFFGSDDDSREWSIDTVVAAELGPRGTLPFT